MDRKLRQIDASVRVFSVYLLLKTSFIIDNNKNWQIYAGLPVLSASHYTKCKEENTMMNKSLTPEGLIRPFALTALAIGMSVTQLASAAKINITVLDQNGAAVPGFRYLVEEDTTYKPTLNVPAAGFDSLSFEFHKSHNPVATDAAGKGISGSSLTPADNTASITVADNKNYFVSVVPYNGHALSGVAVEMGTVDIAKTVVVNSFPIPTTQISVRVFEDNSPVNGAIDLDEHGLQFSIIDGQKHYFDVKLFDAAGQYGMAGGRVIADAYGNPLGTDYDADGNVTFTPPNGFNLRPDANGYLVIKHLPPAKYGVEITPPARESANGEPIWVQTSTIEGTRTIDAWVKANEPEVFVEFGPPGPHVFVGFVRNYDCMSGDTGYVQGGLNACQDEIINADGDKEIITSDPVTGGATITGQIVDNHMSRPGPLQNADGSGGSFIFSNGKPFEGCRVAINEGIQGRTIYSQKCDFDDPDPDTVPASFTVDDLAPGSYSLSIWDDGLDAVIANHPFNVAGNEADGYTISSLLNPAQLNAAGQTLNCGGAGNAMCDFGQIPVFNWFNKMDTVVFYDQNQNGFRDCENPDCNIVGEDDVTMFAEASATNLRWRDGRMYKSVPIDVFGEAPHEEVFPFFHWLVAEVDFATFKATGATMTADAGGDSATLQDDGYVAQLQTVPACSGTMVDGVDTNDAGEGCSHDGGLTRTETGAVLTQAFQGFLGQKNTIEFGKANYEPGENGGISGMAIYAITRAEHDPRYAAAEEWEPGIPRVQIALYKDSLDTTGAAPGAGDEIIDDLNGNGVVDLPDVDNHPLGWGEGTAAKGPEDIDRNGNGAFDKGDAWEVTWTDSWDDNVPTNCGGSNGPGFETIDTKCFDGLRNWNQVRPGVFDGGYAFPENLPAAYYIVQSFTPPGYTLLKEEDKNVDFGDEYGVPQLLPPTCIGDDHLVPAKLSHVMDGTTQGIADDPTDPEALNAPFANTIRPLCDTKRVRVGDSRNAAADFHYFTEVPKAAHVVGGVINDVANEFNPLAPSFGEKFTPPWVPVAFYDFNGHEVTRVYTDQYGKYNAMLPSTNTVNVGSPSGMAPNMLTACMNDSGLIESPKDSGLFITDPNHNPQYSQFCYTFQYMPGGTTYLDTPVVSVAAFAGSGYQLDCDAADATPMISSVFSGEYPNHGAYISDPTAATATLTINAVGLRSVPNPSATELSSTTEKNVLRDYGFGGTEGTVWFIDKDGHATAATSSAWANDVITVDFPQGLVPETSPGTYPIKSFQLVVENANGVSSPMAVTVTVGTLRWANSEVRLVDSSTAAGATPIQDALDASAQLYAGQGDIILVAPGTYDELPIMYQPVALQGAGAYSTFINARSVPAEKVVNWRAKVNDLLGLDPDGPNFNNPRFTLLPGQEGAELFVTEEGPGLMVVSKSFGNRKFVKNRPARIDGFSITGASTGGGVFVNGFVQGFSITNNLIAGNQGTYGGGIRLGHNTVKEQVVGGDLAGTFRHPDAMNRNIQIRNNMITRNGVFNGAGGGIAIYTGSLNYRVENNLICGNFAMTDGAGIGHLGLSSGGQINSNQIIFNQSFRQTPGMETDGGGILIAGADSFNLGALTAGAGRGQINKNLIQGNQAGAGDGAGIALRRVNGLDVEGTPDTVGDWWLVNVDNNTIVNNVAGYGGGAMSLKEAVRVNIRNNTMSNNESTATAGAAFALGTIVDGNLVSDPQVAGIVSRPHEGLAGLIQIEDDLWRYNQGFSLPFLRNNIIWQNRSRIYELATNSLVDPGGATTPVYNDFSAGLIVTTAGQKGLSRNNLMTANVTGDHSSNISGDPSFEAEYVNRAPGLNPAAGAEFQTIQVSPALDEGGNWLDVRYAPLSINDIDKDIDGEQPSDYHLIDNTSIAVNAGINNRPNGNTDIDNDPRVLANDLGSDEVQ